jgi:hypothetical protein
MQEVIARQVHKVFGYGIDLKERIDRGERPDLNRVLQDLKGLLLGAGELKGVADWVGDVSSSTRTVGGLGGRNFMGIQYALTCWLDEIFTVYTPEDWFVVYNEAKLEPQIYPPSPERAWRFWEQAELAERRPGTDALEAYYWAVMLGFRGDWRHEPDKLAKWAKEVRARIISSQSAECPMPPETDPPTYVPPLTARASFTNALRLWFAIVLLSIPVLLILVAQWRITP